MRNETNSLLTTYIESLAASDDPGLRSIEERLRAAGKWGINIGPNEGRLLSLLTHLSGARKAVEIGTLYGYSTVWIARSLAEGGRLWTIERDPVCAAAARQGFMDCGVDECISLLEGEASERLTELTAEAPFDLVFIDANKSAYPDYLDWAEKNLRPGGLVIADNVFLGGATCEETKPAHVSQKQWQAMRDFNHRLMKGGAFLPAFIPTSEGLLIGMRSSH